MKLVVLFSPRFRSIRYRNRNLLEQIAQNLSACTTVSLLSPYPALILLLYSGPQSFILQNKEEEWRIHSSSLFWSSEFILLLYSGPQSSSFLMYLPQEPQCWASSRCSWRLDGPLTALQKCVPRKVEKTCGPGAAEIKSEQSEISWIDRVLDRVSLQPSPPPYVYAST